jgi:4-hydroxybenzoate polyprenyltransferase
MENDSPNPFTAPKNTNASGDEGPSAPVGLTTEMCGNLTLTSKLVRVVAVVAGIGALVSSYHAFEQIQKIPRDLISSTVRFLITVSLWVFVMMLWKYAASIDLFAREGTDELHYMIEREAKLWLSTVFFVFSILVTIALVLFYL